MVETRPNRDETIDLRSRTRALKRRRTKREFRTRLIHVSAAAGWRSLKTRPCLAT